MVQIRHVVFEIWPKQEVAPIVGGGHFEIQDGGRFRNGKKCYQWISCTEFHNLSEKYNFPFIGKKITG